MGEPGHFMPLAKKNSAQLLAFFPLSVALPLNDYGNSVPHMK
jgi:hypothetical protein